MSDSRNDSPKRPVAFQSVVMIICLWVGANKNKFTFLSLGEALHLLQFERKANIRHGDARRPRNAIVHELRPCTAKASVTDRRAAAVDARHEPTLRRRKRNPHLQFGNRRLEELRSCTGVTHFALVFVASTQFSVQWVNKQHLHNEQKPDILRAEYASSMDIEYLARSFKTSIGKSNDYCASRRGLRISFLVHDRRPAVESVTARALLVVGWPPNY